MKMLLPYLYLGAMLVGLSACGGSKSPAADVSGTEVTLTEQPKITEVADNEKAEKPEKVEEKEPEVTKAPFEEEKPEEKVEDKKEEEKNPEKVTDEDDNFSVVPIIEETILWDEAGLKITATKLTYTTYNAELSLILENNGDEEVSVVAGSLGYCCNSINDYMVNDGYLNVDLPAGKKANKKISFSLEELKLYGLKEIADIQVGFDITIGEEEIYTGPRKVKTSVADTYDYEKNAYRENMSSGKFGKISEFTIDSYNDQEISVMDGVVINSYALVSNTKKEKILLLEVKNETEEVIRCGEEGLTVNNLSVYTYAMESDYIAPGCRCVIAIELDSHIEDSYRSAFGLTSFDKLGFLLKVRDKDYKNVLAEKKIFLLFNEDVASIDTSGTEVLNEDGIRIVAKGLYEDSSKYSEDIHLVMLLENDFSKTIQIDDVYNSLSVNGFMTDYSLYSKVIESGERCVIDIEIKADSLTENGIESTDDITEIEVSIKIRDKNYKVISEPTLKVNIE